MINVSDVITDPDFAQPFTVYRSSGGQFISGGWSEGTPEQISLKGIVTVGSEKDLQQVPEGDRVEGAMLFYAIQELLTSHKDPGTSDQILWNGDFYRVQKVWNYGKYGYWKAYGVRMEGA